MKAATDNQITQLATIRGSSAKKSSRPSRADIRSIASLAEQDMSGEVDDSYASTGDAADTIRRWYASARSAGDTDLIETVDRMGVMAAAQAYEAARRGSAHAAAVLDHLDDRESHDVERPECFATMKGNLVTVETMPEYLKASHRAARNWGVYPHNGALRERVTRDEADEIVAADPDGYARIV